MDGQDGGNRYGSADGKARRVLAALRSDIVTGVLAQGERLTEARLCERYRVSRVPVREALRTLAVQGFVEVRPNQGATVATIDDADAEDLFAVRGTIEEIAAARCAARVAGGEDAVVDLLGRLVAEGEAELASGRTEQLPELNTRFHLAIAEHSGSASLPSLLRHVSDRIEWIYAMGVSVAGPRSWAEHRAILAAIAAGDPASAGALARAHVERAERHHRGVG